MPKNKLLLFLIILSAFLVRIYKIDSIPVSLNWDEISHGYNAYSLLKTGYDQWGISWPIFNFRAYGDYPTALNLYLTIPFIKVFGLNSFAIRLPGVLLSTIFVWYSFTLASFFTPKKSVPYIIAILTAFTPWTFFPARAVFQSNISQLLLVAFLYHLFSAQNKPKHFFLAAIFGGLAPYSYHNTRIIIPILSVFLLFYLYQELRKSFIQHRLIVLSSLTIFLLLLVPNLINLSSPTSLARNQWIGIINQNSINLINESRRLFQGPDIVNVLLNNRYLYFVKTVTINYLNLFNPYPLFLIGSENLQFNPPNTGLIFLFLLPFFYIGIIKSPKFLPLTLICLLPSALTTGDFPSIRATTATFFYYLFIATGITSLNIFRHFLFKLSLIVVFMFSVINYFNKYYQYNFQYSPVWQDGYSDMVNYVKKNYSAYDRILISKKYGEPHEFILFYWPWDPKAYQVDINKVTDYHSGWYWVDRFDKFYFINDWEVKNQILGHKDLLISSPDNHPQDKYIKIGQIYFKNGQSAFTIYENP